MSYLSTAISRMRELGSSGLPEPPTTQPEIQRNFALLDGSVGTVEAAEELVPFLERALNSKVFDMPRTELNRVLRGVWCSAKFDALANEVLERADDEKRRSSDQAMIEGYLSWFPNDRAILEKLALAAHAAAGRHDWAWKARSKSFSMFKPDIGPSKVAKKLIEPLPEGVRSLISGIGLGQNLAASGFGKAVFISACDLIAEKRGPKAITGQEQLLELFDTDSLAGNLSSLARALLQPWLNDKPDPKHRKAISDLLLDQIGDPRTKPVSWRTIVTDMASEIGVEQANAVMQVLKRWLTEVAMREFFRAIMETTDRKDQWAERQKFWLAYLDAGLVLDAWPALGIRAENEIEAIIRKSGERPEYAKLRSGPAGSSTIIMQIGNLRIAEWSDDGSCRFWNDANGSKPNLYRKLYNANKLRTTSGGPDFEYIGHRGNWQPKFANFIYKQTNIEHPIHGTGWSYNYY